MDLVAAAKDGVVLYISEAEDVVKAGLISGVEIADDGGGVRLPGVIARLRGAWPQGSSLRWRSRGPFYSFRE